MKSTSSNGSLAKTPKVQVQNLKILSAVDLKAKIKVKIKIKVKVKMKVEMKGKASKWKRQTAQPVAVNAAPVKAELETISMITPQPFETEIVD